MLNKIKSLLFHNLPLKRKCEVCGQTTRNTTNLCTMCECWFVRQLHNLVFANR